MKINIGAKSLTEGVSYIRPVKELSVGNYEEKKAVFMIETLTREVMSGSPSQQARKVKQLKKLVKGFAVITAVSIQSAPKALAATATVTGQAITPAAIMQWGLSLAAITVSSGVALSMVMLGVAGIYKMFRKGDIASQWSLDIVKGLVQVLISVPVVYALFYLAQVVFKNLPALGSLF